MNKSEEHWLALYYLFIHYYQLSFHLPERNTIYSVCAVLDVIQTSSLRSILQDEHLG